MTSSLSDCGWNCSVDYDVVVPRGTTVTGHAGSGDIKLDGVASADVSTDSGSVKVHTVAGPVNAQAASGNIEGDRLGGKVDARVDSGSVTLRLEVVQDVRASADSGNVDLDRAEGQLPGRRRVRRRQPGHRSYLGFFRAPDATAGHR